MTDGASPARRWLALKGAFGFAAAAASLAFLPLLESWGLAIWALLESWGQALVAVLQQSPIPVGLSVVALLVAGTLAALLRRAKRITTGPPTPVAEASPKTSASAAPSTTSGGPSRPPTSTKAFGLRLTGFFVLVVGPFLWFSGRFFFYYNQAVADVGAALFWPGGWPASALRSLAQQPPDYIFIMYLSGILAYILTIATSRRNPYPASARRDVAALLLAYLLLSVVAAALLDSIPIPAFALSVSLLMRALLGSFFFMGIIFSTLVIPPPMRVVPILPRDSSTYPLFMATATVAIGGAAAVLLLLYQYAGLGRLVLPFAVLLLLPTYAITFWGVAGRVIYAYQLRQHPIPSVTEYHPPVSVIIPAYNEAANIVAAIHSVDLAAQRYPGVTELLVGNDGSADRTAELAREALGQLQHARGRLLDLPHGGKSSALNAMLREAQGEVLVRVDADSRISDQTGFASMIPHFADPEVGGVQGTLLPLQRDGWTRKLRFMEIAWNHLFLRRAFYALRAAQVVDGAFCAFRRKDLLDVGGWVTWNGEDTEITLRLQRLGYRMRFEPGSTAYEDVPANYKDLKKQRVRWTRGGLFAHLRHYGSLFSTAPEFGGLAMVVWLTIFARGGMRQLVYFYALLATLLLHLPTLYHLALIIGLMFVPRALVIAAYTVKFRWKAGLRWIPIWPATSGVKQFFTTEAFGTMLPGLVAEFSE